MSRPVEFDTEKAIDKALLLFWRKGYQATSLADLLEAMGISRSSFYAAYGDKRSLFLICLDRFVHRTEGFLQKARQKMAPLDALQFFFEDHLERPKRGKTNLGCLMVNTVLEMSNVDEGLSERASRGLAHMEKLFDATLREAGCDAEQASEMAAMLMLLNEGVRVSSRRRLSLAAQLAPISATFAMLRRQLEPPAQRASA